MEHAIVELVGCHSYSWGKYTFKKNIPQVVRGSREILYFQGQRMFSVRPAAAPKVSTPKLPKPPAVVEASPPEAPVITAESSSEKEEEPVSKPRFVKKVVKKKRRIGESSSV